MLPVETVLWPRPEPDISANVTASACTRTNRPQYCRETLGLTFDHPFETLSRHTPLRSLNGKSATYNCTAKEYVQKSFSTGTQLRDFDSFS